MPDIREQARQQKKRPAEVRELQAVREGALALPWVGLSGPNSAGFMALALLQKPSFFAFCGSVLNFQKPLDQR